MAKVHKFPKHGSQSYRVHTMRAEGITSTTDAAFILKVPRGSTIKAIPTAAGTATVYSTQTPFSIGQADADNSHSEVTNSTNRSWDAWGAGAVTATTIQQANGPLEGIALTVASGTWTIEVTAGAN